MLNCLKGAPARVISFSPHVQAREHITQGDLPGKLIDTRLSPCPLQSLDRISEPALGPSVSDAFDNLMGAIRPKTLAGFMQSHEKKADAQQALRRLHDWGVDGKVEEFEKVGPNYVIALAQLMAYKREHRPEQATQLVEQARPVTDAVLHLLESKIRVESPTLYGPYLQRELAAKSEVFLTFAEEKGLCSRAVLDFMHSAINPTSSKSA